MTTEAALSVDLEYFTHTPAYRQADGETDAPDVGREGVEFLLDLLDRHGATATFFTVSEVAETDPDLVARVAEAGHEVASHTRTHRLLTELSTGETHEELSASKRRLEKVTGSEVSGFRAPAFDFESGHFERLAEVGYEYDSSVAPCRRIPGWYGGDHDALAPFRAVGTNDTPVGIEEVPVGVFPGLRLPLTGTWLRFFGRRYTTVGMSVLARRGVAPVLYVHPWELVDLPDIDGVPARVYWHTGEWMRQAVQQLLSQPFEFKPIRDIVATAVDDE
jgi:peptidoglycan/xylan/chitin deacetylase (PgdA/CDA1 family)